MWGFIFLVFVKVKLIFNIHEDMLRIFSMRKLLLFFTAIMFSLLNSCVQESALSDVDIDDPSIIKPVISIDKSINTNSIIYTNITWLFDKNNNSIELKSGEVKMNNIDMTLKRGINNEPYYTIEPFDILPFQLNYTYESEISLSDEEVYTSRVTTRGKDLYQLNVPAEHNKNEDIQISWADIENDEELVLTMVLTGSDDSTTYIDVYKFNISYPLSGSYTVSKNYFINRPEINKAQLTLEAINTGEINNSFMNGSKITSTISITRYTNLR